MNRISLTKLLLLASISVLLQVGKFGSVPIDTSSIVEASSYSPSPSRSSSYWLDDFREQMLDEHRRRQREEEDGVDEEGEEMMPSNRGRMSTRRSSSYSTTSSTSHSAVSSPALVHIQLLHLSKELKALANQKLLQASIWRQQTIGHTDQWAMKELSEYLLTVCRKGDRNHAQYFIETTQNGVREAFNDLLAHKNGNKVSDRYYIEFVGTKTEKNCISFDSRDELYPKQYGVGFIKLSAKELFPRKW